MDAGQFDVRELDARQVATGLAASRVAVGTALFVLPRVAGRVWLGREGSRPGAEIALRGMGIRDAALGAGALMALSADQPADRWLEAGIASDVGDVVGALASRRRASALSVLATVLLGGAAAAVGAWARFAEEGDTLPGLSSGGSVA